MDISLQEGGAPVEVRLAAEMVASLVATGAVSAAPTTSPGVWLLTAGTKVGALSVTDVVVRIAPKIDIRRVVFLLGYALNPDGWRDTEVPLRRDDDLLSAVADAYVRQAERALREGLLHGYRMRDDTLTVLRGRLRDGAQVRRRFALPVPLEVSYDDFIVDVVENRTLKAAALRLLKLPGVRSSTRNALRRVAFAQLADVGWEVSATERWRPSRLNMRYQPALRLAEVILAGQSFDHAAGPLPVTGFLIDMARVFEDFVTVALSHALAAYGGVAHRQYTTYLDVAQRVSVRPDLVWLSGNSPVGVVDAKYKSESGTGSKHSDLYQMLAYCSILRLGEGHLVYAKGYEQPARHEVRNSGVRITCHALDLQAIPTDLLAQIDAIAAVLRVDAHHG